MNCKPGDMARMVGLTLDHPNYGRLVEVTRPAKHEEIFVSCCGLRAQVDTQGEVTWVIRASSPLAWTLYDESRLMFYERPIGDRWLRPIRDPGDDAVDESLLWLPSPTKEQA